MSVSLHTYLDFFKAFGLRKRNDLLSPRYHPIADIVMPKDSIIHYMPVDDQDMGPGYPQAFISNYPDEVYIDFQFGFSPLIGHGKTLPYTPTQDIKFYRNKHYQYKWTKNPQSIYSNQRKLMVVNHALAFRSYRYSANMYLNFYKSYNAWSLLINSINETGNNHPQRHQFVRIDLPVNMPSFKNLLDDSKRYVKIFNEEGLPIISDNKVIRSTKAENCYWLIDWLLFLQGDKEHSLFGKLDREVCNNLHFLFCSNSTTWVVNIGLLLSWYEPIQDKPDKIYNANKRVYLDFIHLVNGSVGKTESESSDEEQQGRSKVAGGEEPAEDNGSRETERGRGNDHAESKAGQTQPETSNSDHVDLIDVFRRPQKNTPKSSGTDESPRSQNDAGSATGLSRTETGNVASRGPEELQPEGTETLPEVEDLNWLSPIEDHLLEPAVVSDAISTVKDVFARPTAGIALALEEKARDGVLTVRQKEYYEEKAKSYQTIVMPNGQTMEEFINITEDELKDVGGDIKGDFPTVTDKTMLRQRVVSLRNDYPKKFLHKDIAASVLNLQNAGLIIADYQIEHVEDIESALQIVKIQFMPVNGKTAIRQFPIPAVDEYGMTKVDGVKTYRQFQRMEFPIRKISERRVVLTSHYDKKVNVTRSEMVADDYNKRLIRQIALAAEQKTLTVNNANLINRNITMPRYVTMLNRKYRSITVNKGEYLITLDFDTDALLELHPEWKKYKKATIWPVGEYKGKVLTLNSYGIIYNEDVPLGTLEDVLGLDMRNSPIENAVINVNGYPFPAGVVLCYYFGIDKLLEVINPQRRVIPAGQRYRLNYDEFSLDFNDERIIMSKREGMASLIFGGMSKLDNMSNFSRSDLNGRGVWVPLMADPKIRPTHFKEMKNMFDLFIDPITKERLAGKGFSTSFHYLLIDAIKMLLTDNTRHEVEIEEQQIIGYEGIVSHVYSEMCKSNRQFKNKTETGSQTFDLNPQAIITNIITDPAMAQVKEMSPFHAAKSQEDITFGGFKGRDEQTMLKRTRAQLKSYRGVISEANKDNGKVGFVGYTTGDPRVKDFRGGIDTSVVSEGSQLLSSIGNLKYGSTFDDPKRASFASIQSSHAISARNYTPNIIRTGQDNLFAHRLDDTYAKTAKKAGKVVSLTAEGIVVEYEDGTRDSTMLGLKLGKSDGEVYRHTLITDLVIGQTFPEGTVLSWDDEWFAKDPYCPGQVSVKVGKMVRAVFKEDQTVYEDSMEFWSGLAKEFVTPVPKEFTFYAKVEETVRLRRKVGDKVEFDSILCEVSDSYVDNFESDDDILNEINREGIKQIKSSYDGEVINIEVAYNAIEDEMSDSVKKLVREHDRKRASLSTLLGKGPMTNRVGTGVSVNKASIPYGMVRITIHVESLSPATISDKFVYGNQMKGTLGYVVEKQMHSEDGRPIPFKFSFKSMFKRMVISLRNKAVVTEYSYGVKDEFISLARGKKA